MNVVFRIVKKIRQGLGHIVIHAIRKRNDRVRFDELLHTSLFRKNQPEVNRNNR